MSRLPENARGRGQLPGYALPVKQFPCHTQGDTSHDARKKDFRWKNAAQFFAYD